MQAVDLSALLGLGQPAFTTEPELEISPEDELAAQLLARTRLYFDSEKNPLTGLLSEHYPCKFTTTSSGNTFYSVWQYFCWGIAKVCGDEESAKKILALVWDYQPNGLGQIDWVSLDRTRGDLFKICSTMKIDPAIYEANRIQLMKRAVGYKFCQNQHLFDAFMATEAHVLVYASTSDKVWGIGIAAEHAHQVPVENWGSNDLGCILMAMRTEFKEKGKPDWAHIKGALPASDHRSSEKGKEEESNGLVVTEAPVAQ